MLTENMPNLSGASIPYSLGYVPGPWLQSIQVSKGASSVKSGYESITGQINIEYLKPQGTDGVRANAYLDNKLKQEEAWNTGASLSFNIPVAGKELELNIDYYYTDFDNQMMLNPYTYQAYFQLQAQITREFRYFLVYVGGENLTRYTISDPIRSAADPWSAMFDATQVWGPTEGAMFYIGMRFKLEKM